MDENLTEKEQLEEIAKWWDENKMYVITGLVLGAGVLGGWNYFKTQKLTRAYSASALHSSLADAVASGNADAASAAASQLAGDYGSTPYAALAPLTLAKLHVDNGDLDAAADALSQALDAPAEISYVARLRLARVRLAQDRPSDALTVLEGPAGTFAPLFAEVRGDAHAALGDKDQAKAAYEKALDSSGGALDRNMIQMKVDALGVGIASTQ